MRLTPRQRFAIGFLAVAAAVGVVWFVAFKVLSVVLEF